MKRRFTPFTRLSYLKGLLALMACLLLALPTPAQAPASQAQASVDEDGKQHLPQQGNGQAANPIERFIHPQPQPTAPKTQLQIQPSGINDWANSPAWEKAMAHKARPAHSQRTIPLVIVLLGLLFMLLWTAILIGAILATGTVLTLILVIAAIVFSPLVIIGMIMVIGGIVSGASGGKKK